MMNEIDVNDKLLDVIENMYLFMKDNFVHNETFWDIFEMQYPDDAEKIRLLIENGYFDT